MARFMAELGLTPSARSRLAIQVPTGRKPWEPVTIELAAPGTAADGAER